MEKVKVTQEQADVLFEIARMSKGIPAKVLISALKNGFDIESEFEVGDWVISKATGDIGKVTEVKKNGDIVTDVKLVSYRDDFFLTGKPSAFEKKTPEEIAQEKERRWWKKHNRRVWELKKGDLLKDPFGEIEEVKKIKNNGYDLGIYNVYRTLDCIKKRYSVACFVEDRKDV